MNYFLLLVIFFVQTSYGISAPEYTNHYFKYAMEDFQNEKYESALKRLEKIKKSGIYSRRAIELYAHTLMKLKRFDEAIDTFEEMANFYHPEGFVYHKNIPETEDYLGKRKTSKNPPDRVLDYYQDLGHIHFMILKENMEKREHIPNRDQRRCFHESPVSQNIHTVTREHCRKKTADRQNTVPSPHGIRDFFKPFIFRQRLKRTRNQHPFKRAGSHLKQIMIGERVRVNAQLGQVHPPLNKKTVHGITDGFEKIERDCPRAHF